MAVARKALLFAAISLAVTWLVATMIGYTLARLQPANVPTVIGLLLFCGFALGHGLSFVALTIAGVYGPVGLVRQTDARTAVNCLLIAISWFAWYIVAVFIWRGIFHQ